MTTIETTGADFIKWPVSQRNYMLDSLFYDTGALTAKEKGTLSPSVDREGTIIVLSPAKANRDIRHYRNALRFMNKEGRTVRAIAIAGVGSSVLGAAALARNVANHYGCDVAGIVTGYGLTDLVSEAMGGWFFYGFIDRARYEMASRIASLATSLPETPAVSPKGDEKSLTAVVPLDSRFVVPGNSDAGTFLDVLVAAPPNLSLIVCHSKGCLLTSFVLHHLVREMGADPHPYYDNLGIITLGAVVDLPKQFKRQFQFLGKLDWFGGLNSCLEVPHSTIPRAWHHLNSEIPMHLSVDEALKNVPLTQADGN